MKAELRISASSGDRSTPAGNLPPWTGRNDSSFFATDSDNATSDSIDPTVGARHHVVFSPIATDLHSDTRTACSSDYVDSVDDFFEKASAYLHPGQIFRSIVYLYGERKLLVFFLLHFVCTMIVWLHFAMIKFEQQKISVPDGAPFYWLKRMAPTLEFGTMHAILLQMALLPLTMTRYSISTLSGTILDQYVPFKRTLRMHIHLGYTMVLTVAAATLFFFFFFGLLCRRGEQTFCDKFTSEIMATGYAIFIFLLVIGISSYFRHKIPYEVFYVLHHLLVILYIVTILHTFDVEERLGRANRSQTFKWFSATTLYYVCDRLAMHMTQKHRTKLLSSSTISGSDGSRMVMINLRRPPLFSFKAGQYAYLKIASIDTHWHPFSISSDPSSEVLQFYVEVFGARSWTGKLWDLIDEDAGTGFSAQCMDVEIMGPIGTELANTNKYSHILAIGTGSGIVPILSMFKQQVNQLLRLDPVAHLEALERHRQNVHEIEMANDLRKGSIVHHLCTLFTRKKPYAMLRSPTNEVVKEKIRSTIARFEANCGSPGERAHTSKAKMKGAAFRATRSIYGGVLLSIVPAIGVSLIGLMISWNTIDTHVSARMVFFLKLFTVGFQFMFMILSMFVWDAAAFLAYIDLAVVVIIPFADWYWLPRCQEGKSLRSNELILYGILTGYMVLRIWGKAVSTPQRSWYSQLEANAERTIERTEVVWICRSASLVSELLPEIESLWKRLGEKWGSSRLNDVCRISINVTDADQHACCQLKDEIGSTNLYKSGFVKFGRPDIPSLVRQHTIELVGTRKHSHTLLAYVGSPSLAKEIHHHKISNDVLCAITGYKNHQIEYVSDCHGGAKTPTEKLKDSIPPENPRDQNNERYLPRRVTRTYDHSGRDFFGRKHAISSTV